MKKRMISLLLVGMLTMSVGAPAVFAEEVLEDSVDVYSTYAEDVDVPFEEGQELLEDTSDSSEEYAVAPEYVQPEMNAETTETQNANEQASVYGTIEQDFYEGTYNGYGYTCRANGSGGRCAVEIEYENSSPTVFAEMTVSLSTFLGMTASSKTVTGSGSGYAIASWSDGVSCLATAMQFKFKVGSSRVYSNSLRWSAY